MAPLDSPVHKAAAYFLSVFRWPSWTTSVHSLPPFQTARLPKSYLLLHLLVRSSEMMPKKTSYVGSSAQVLSHPSSPSFLQLLMFLLWNSLTLRTLVPARLSTLDFSYRIPCMPLTTAILWPFSIFYIRFPFFPYPFQSIFHVFYVGNLREQHLMVDN